MMPTIVYCANGNERFARIAIEAGYRYGAQLPGTVYLSVWFADQDWKKPNREGYMAALAEHRPEMATVLDWERDEQLPEVLDWAEEAAQYVNRVLIIPKVMGGIAHLPRRINGTDVVLAYSVPTRYGGTQLPLWEFRGWPMHLLGGSPQRQMNVWQHLSCIAEVVSVDGNYANKMATKWNQFWMPGNARFAQNRYWPRLREADGQDWGEDAPYEAFRRSCQNIVAEWEALTTQREGEAERRCCLLMEDIQFACADKTEAELEAQLADARDCIDLCNRMIVRAECAWKEQHPDSEFYPDVPDLIVWLKEQVDTLSARRCATCKYGRRISDIAYECKRTHANLVMWAHDGCSRWEQSKKKREAADG